MPRRCIHSAPPLSCTRHPAVLQGGPFGLRRGMPCTSRRWRRLNAALWNPVCDSFFGAVRSASQPSTSRVHGRGGCGEKTSFAARFRQINSSDTSFPSGSHGVSKLSKKKSPSIVKAKMYHATPFAEAKRSLWCVDFSIPHNRPVGTRNDRPSLKGFKFV